MSEARPNSLESIVAESVMPSLKEERRESVSAVIMDWRVGEGEEEEEEEEKEEEEEEDFSMRKIDSITAITSPSSCSFTSRRCD